MLIGSGSNGKSMFMSLVEEFVGPENITGRELQDFSDNDFALNSLQGKLANVATEIGEQEMKDTTAFKKATGRDTVTADVKYESPIQFENHATLMFATNEMPVFGQDNHAIWRRWLYLDFPYKFDEDDPQAKDPEPERVLKRRLFRDEEFEALLLRCQQEIQRWYEGEPFFADAMDADEVREKMKQAAEPVYAFATSCLEFREDEDVVVPKERVRACYQAFADEEDLPRIPDNQFGERLVNLRDFKIEATQRRVDGQRQRVYEYARLSARGRQLLGIDEPDEGDDQETVDGEYEQAKPKVMQRLHEMVDENGGDPVDVNGLAWSVPGVGKTKVKQTIAELKQHGDVVEMDGGIMPTDF
jgi:putative DNA primase/helicase